MINKTAVVMTKGVNPYENLALEEYLLDRTEEGLAILYLWQNSQTVVIGYNQNPWAECRVKQLEEDGGHLARRLSGGGAVFHDMGNLNFTFLLPEKDFDTARQTEVISKAASSYGLDVEKTGRNDILIGGRKFSGNAFFKRKGKAYHHGTLMISADLANLGHYLTVPKDKLEFKGVKSVKSRVANLTEFNPDVTVSGMIERLTDAFGQVYGVSPEIFDGDHFKCRELDALTEKYSSWQWKYGRNLPFDNEISGRFAWGGINIRLHAEGGVIKTAQVFSDSMDSAIMSHLPSVFENIPYSSAKMAEAVRKLAELQGDGLEYELKKTELYDIAALIEEQSF